MLYQSKEPSNIVKGKFNHFFYILLGHIPFVTDCLKVKETLIEKIAADHGLICSFVFYFYFDFFITVKTL